ncbi:MAG: hypothetical protein ACRDZ3_21715 [Acidimicrobiia bacterium]
MERRRGTPGAGGLIVALLLTLAVAPAPAGAAPPSPVLRAEVSAEEVTGADVVVEAQASLPAEDQARLEEAAARLQTEGTPTKFVVVATRPPDTTPVAYAQELRRAAAFDGNLIVLFLSPRSLGLASTAVPDAVLNDTFADVRSELAADPVGGMVILADRLAEPAELPVEQAAPGEGSAVEDTGSDGGGSGGLVAGVLIIGGGVGVGVYALRRAKRRLQERFDERRAGLEPLVDALATQIDVLWQEISAGDGTDRATAAYDPWDVAAQAQLSAREKLRRAQGEDDLSAIRLLLEKGLRAASRARAALEGKPAPAPDAPLLDGLCAFDPSHGKAVDAVEVTTPRGNSAGVPACAACAAQLAEGATPDVRRTRRGSRSVPYWEGAGWDRGGAMMPTFGGILGGLFLADLMFDDHGSGFSDPGGGDWGGGDGGDGGDGGGDWGGGGDFGGGDFGGGGDF